MKRRARSRWTAATAARGVCRTVRDRLPVLLSACLTAALALSTPLLWAQERTFELAPMPDIELFQASQAQTLTPLADGGTLVAGTFTVINGVRRGGLARLEVDGRVDPHWRSSLIGQVRHLLELPDGSLIAAGWVVDPGNATGFSGITRLTAQGTEMPDSRLAISGQVLALALADDGGVFVGGGFSRVGGQSRPYLAKLRIGQSITLDQDWQPAPDHRVTALMVDEQGDLIVGGGFNLIGGEFRGGLAKVSGTGTGALDPDWRPLPDHFISHMAPGPDGSIMVAGYFSRIGGQTRYKLAKLSTTGTGRADPSWNPTADWSPAQTAGDFFYSLQSAPGWLYVGGHFSRVGGATVCCVARLSAVGPGVADPDWVAPPMRPFAEVAVLGLDSEGNLLLGGKFRTQEPEASLGLAHLDRHHGQVIAPMWVGEPGRVDRIGLQPDGGAIIAGRFDLADGQYRESLLRVTADGRVDPWWRPAVAAGVQHLQIDDVGDVFLGGWFQQVNEVPRRYLAKLSGSGAGPVDPDWAPEPDNPVTALAIEPGGSLLVGGRFQVIGNQPRRFLARVQADSTVDPDWTPVVEDWVSALALDRHGRVVAGAANLRRFDPVSGAIDTGWRPALPRSHHLGIGAGDRVFSAFNFRQEFFTNATLSAVSESAVGDLTPLWTQELFGEVRHLLPLTGGGLLVAGQLGRQQPHLLDEALLAFAVDGTPTTGFLPYLDGATHALARSSDGSTWFGGRFVTADGEERLGLARFGAGAGAPPELGVALSPITALVIALLALLGAWGALGRRSPPLPMRRSEP